MITLTERAIRHLETARERDDLHDRDLRLIVRRDPAGGIEYALHWVPRGQALPSDLPSEHGALRVHTEAHSAELVEGAILDYVDGPEGGGFRLDPARAPRS